MGRKRILVPEARDAMERLKAQIIQEQVTSVEATAPSRPSDGAATEAAAVVAKQLGIPYQTGDNGELTTRQAGKIGGEIGGPMVKRLISIAEQNLTKPSGTGSAQGRRS